VSAEEVQRDQAGGADGVRTEALADPVDRGIDVGARRRPRHPGRGGLVERQLKGRVINQLGDSDPQQTDAGGRIDRPHELLRQLRQQRSRLHGLRHRDRSSDRREVVHPHLECDRAPAQIVIAQPCRDRVGQSHRIRHCGRRRACRRGSFPEIAWSGRPQPGGVQRVRTIGCSGGGGRIAQRKRGDSADRQQAVWQREKRCGHAQARVSYGYHPGLGIRPAIGKLCTS